MAKKDAYRYEVKQELRFKGHKRTATVTERRDSGVNDPCAGDRNNRYEYRLDGEWYSEGCLEPVPLK